MAHFANPEPAKTHNLPIFSGRPAALVLHEAQEAGNDERVIPPLYAGRMPPPPQLRASRRQARLVLQVRYELFL